jgi:hypothetical protein
MTWYYVLNDQQKGPVEEAELRRLVQERALDEYTLVWREGMANWQPYAEALPRSPSVAAAPPLVPATAPAPARSEGVVCAECGQVFPTDQVIQIANRNICARCKPIATQKLREGVVSESDSERIRKEHISHEASVKSVGFLYFLSALFVGLAGFGGVMAAVSSSGGGVGTPLAVFFIGLCAVQIWAGMGLRQLKGWARIPTGIISALGLLAFPVGTVINLYILYLLFSKKGNMVFSDDYKRVIQETPQIKYRTSIVVWIFLGLLLILIVLGLGSALFVARRH